MSTHRISKIISNTALITGANVVQKALSFLYFWFLSSRFAPGELGGYLWVLSITGFFVTGLDLGLTPILTREAAKPDAEGKKLVETALWLKIPFAAVTVILMWSLVLLTRRDPYILIMLAVATGIMLFDGYTMAFFAALRARQVITFEAIVLVAFQVLTLILGVVATYTTHNLAVIMAALFVGSALNHLIMQWGARRVYGSYFFPRKDPVSLVHLTKLIPAFATGAVITKIYAVADTIIVGFVAGDLAVGLYSVPAKVATALQTLIPAAFATSIYPSMSNFAATSRDKLRLLFDRSILYIYLLALPITIGLVILAEPIMTTIWPQYRAAVPAFVIMMLGIPFIFLAYPTGSLLNATGNERRNTGNRIIATAANVLMNVVFVPFWGVAGAAAAYAISNALLFALDLVPAWRSVGPSTAILVGRGARAMGAGALMGIFLYATRQSIPFWMAIPAAAALYVILLFAARVLKRGEIDVVRDLLRRRVQDVQPSVYETAPPPHA